MKCPNCGHTESTVTETVNGSRLDKYSGSRANMRPVNAIRRTRRCDKKKCGHRFVTYEVQEDLIDIGALPSANDDDLVG